MSQPSTKHDEFLKARINQEISITFIGGDGTYGILLHYDDICLIVHHPIENGDVGKPYDELFYRHSIRSIH